MLGYKGLTNITQNPKQQEIIPAAASVWKIGAKPRVSLKGIWLKSFK